MKALTPYYVLLHDLRDDLNAVEDYEMGDFDLTELWTGQPLDRPIPAPVRITVSGGRRADYLGNPLSWLIFSKRLAKMVEPYTGAHVQFIPLRLFAAGTGRRVGGYVVANPLGCVDAIRAMGRKDRVCIQQLALRANRIPADRHLFRLSHLPTTVVFSQELFDALSGRGLRGLAARQIMVS